MSKTFQFEESDIVVYLESNELYEFGYYTINNRCIIYKQGERNMQDSYSVKLNQIRRVTTDEMEKLTWGE